MLFRNSGGVSWLIVCLGNPGPRYADTRHNAGFMTADALAKKLAFRIDRASFHALTGRTEIAGESVLVMKPQTYMNDSGEAAAEAARFYRIPPERVLVVLDETQLPVGKLRVRAKGSAGGHNGLKSIIACLGTDEFPRIRLGIGAPPHEDYAMKDWVLSAFKNQDAEEIAAAAERAAEAVVCYITEGPDKTMTRFNG